MSTSYSVQPPFSLSAFHFLAMISFFHFCFWRQNLVAQLTLALNSQWSSCFHWEYRCVVPYAARMVLYDESPGPVTLVPLLAEGTGRKMNDPAAWCLMALGSQLVGEFCVGQWHCLANLQLGSSGGISRRWWTGTERDQSSSSTSWFQSSWHLLTILLCTLKA